MSLSEDIFPFRRPRPRVLFLAHLLPYPLDGGAKIKSYYTLRTLASAHEVTLLAFVRSEEENRHLQTLRPLCDGGVETVLIERSRTKNALDAAIAAATGQPFIVHRDRIGKMQALVSRRLAGQRYDAIHIDHLQMAQYALPRATGARLILDHHNVESQIIRQLAQTSLSPAARLYARLEWPKLQRYELQVCRQCDQVLTVTQADASLLQQMAPDLTQVSAIPIGVDGDYFAPIVRFSDPQTLLSIGTMYWPPNVDGMLWFYESVFPLIQNQAPGTHLSIVGTKPTAQIRALADNNPQISVFGDLEDVRPTASDCAAFIVPLLSGSGMRVKILNALAMALPIVSTTVGAEGIAVTPGENILIADTPGAFADACLRLLRDPALGLRLGESGRRLIETRYSWDALGARLLETYRRVLSK